MARQEEYDDPPGQHQRKHLRDQQDQRHRGTDQPRTGESDPRQDLRHPVRHDDRVRRQPVHPLPGVRGGHGAVVLLHQPLVLPGFQAVLTGRPAQLLQIPADRSPGDLQQDEHRQLRRCDRESLPVPCNGSVHDTPEKQRVPHPADAQQQLHDDHDQSRPERLPGRHLQDPADHLPVALLFPFSVSHPVLSVILFSQSSCRLVRIASYATSAASGSMLQCRRYSGTCE